MPEAARGRLTDKEYEKTTAKKRADTRAGKQFSAQPAEIAAKTAHDRAAPPDLQTFTRAALLVRARQAGIAGRSRMRKNQLIEALGQ